MCFLEQQLGFVMNLWKGDKPSVLAGDLYNLNLENKNINCQKFFNYFGCAAKILHHLFVSKSFGNWVYWLFLFIPLTIYCLSYLSS